MYVLKPREKLELIYSRSLPYFRFPQYLKKRNCCLWDNVGEVDKTSILLDKRQLTEKNPKWKAQYLSF